MSYQNHDAFAETSQATLADVLAWATETGEKYDAIKELEKIPARLGMIDEDIGLIPADPGHFERRVAPSSYGPVARRAKDLETSRKRGNARVRALLERFHAANTGSPAAAAPTGDWDRLIALVVEREGFSDQGALFTTGKHKSLFTLRARANCNPRDLNEDAVERMSREMSADKRKSLRKALALLRQLQDISATDPAFDGLLPAKTLANPAPSGRAKSIHWDDLPEDFRASVDRTIRACLAQHEDRVALARERMAAGEDAATVLAELESEVGKAGRRIPKNVETAREGYLGAVKWLVRAAETEGLPRAELRDLRQIMIDPLVDTACKQQLDRARNEESLRDPRKSQSLRNRLVALRTLAAHGLRDRGVVATIDLMKKELYKAYIVEPGEQMAPEAERVCEILQHSPETATRFVNGPALIAEVAEREIIDARACGSEAREYSALRRYAAAVMFAIQMSRPVRTSNLIRVRYRGTPEAAGHLTWMKKKAHAEIKFPVGEIKNDRVVAIHVLGADAAILWRWMTDLRPRFLELKGIADTPYIFPGEAAPRFAKKGVHLPKGAMAPSVISEIWRLGTAVVGLELTPHQARHAVATLVLAIYPGNFALVASILGDTEETVRQHYGRDNGKAAAASVREALLARHPTLFKQMKRRHPQ